MKSIYIMSCLPTLMQRWFATIFSRSMIDNTDTPWCAAILQLLLADLWPKFPLGVLCVLWCPSWWANFLSILPQSAVWCQSDRGLKLDYNLKSNIVPTMQLTSEESKSDHALNPPNLEPFFSHTNCKESHADVSTVQMNVHLSNP